ncbi:uncharacterized protein LOC117238931 [Bombus vosnesenskii]|uniref:Uncharacterized protein LOC117238931 n=1 Tax=Bombus vosnesenskii TaxID=207650 RepID=A0A6J3L448_9HYME|nr:uncharacterized protein LOC117238931 [Bombus vosnesenskii]
MESACAKIEMLRGEENWLQWRFVMRTLLEEDDDLINVCEGNLCHPGNSAEKEIARERFLKADRLARKLIVTSRQFFDFTWEESENVSYNLSKLELIAAKMKALGSEIGEKMLITHILSVLPNKFDHFHNAWDSVEEGKKTLDRLSTRLMTEEIRWKKDDQETSVALVTKNNNYKREQQKQSNNKRSNSRDNQESRNQNRDHSGIGPLGSTSAIQAPNPDVWIIDSGATDHMTGRQEWFSVFEEFDNTVKIEIGDDTFMDACGKGKIRVETFVGGK